MAWIPSTYIQPGVLVLDPRPTSTSDLGREGRSASDTLRRSCGLRIPYGVTPHGLYTEAEWDDDEPADHLHREVGGAHHLSIVAGQTDDGESEVGNDRAESADRQGDMRGERELAETWFHGHGIPNAG